MRIFIFLYIILTAASHSTQAQVDTAFLKTLDSTIRQYQHSGTVYYVDKMNDPLIRSNLNVFSTTHIVSALKTPTIDTIILTKKELRYIQRQLKQLKSFYWPDHLINNSRSIPIDSLRAFVSRLDRHALDSVRLLKDVRQQNNYLTNRYKQFVFSKPIYIRERSIFLLFFLWYDGGGSESLTFYRKDGNSWKEWIVVNMGSY